jgi:serine-type D-Ala-D-Ala carboxypeptidase (penicillin-binding protein 5/6)
VTQGTVTHVEHSRPRPARRASRWRAIVVVAAGAALVAAVTGWPAPLGWGQPSPPHTRLRSITVHWPENGQSAIAVVGVGQSASPQASEPVPIASVAKVMTAYLVLRDYPLPRGEPGFTLSFSAADVRRERAERAAGQSTVAVAAGEQLTERQALEALLLPSANNVAMALADRVSGSIARFVTAMNAEAGHLRLRHTHYTDPSGLAASTVSTARDQLRLAEVVMRNPTFAAIVSTTQTRIPVAGTIANTDTLLGTDGFVGVKTGSDDAAGGCFMFEDVRALDGRKHVVFGVVLGQVDGPLIPAVLAATTELVDDVMDQLAAR